MGCALCGLSKTGHHVHSSCRRAVCMGDAHACCSSLVGHLPLFLAARLVGAASSVAAHSGPIRCSIREVMEAGKGVTYVHSCGEMMTPRLSLGHINSRSRGMQPGEEAKQQHPAPTESHTTEETLACSMQDASGAATVSACCGKEKNAQLSMHSPARPGQPRVSPT